jgi:uncharacterized protein
LYKGYAYPNRKGHPFLSKRFNTINGSDLLHMVHSASDLLNRRMEDVNALNVFPVPDGDTGTNMSLTLGSGVNELNKKASEHIGQAAEALSKGLLMGARGNSGVILSQLFRGFAKGVHDHDEVNVLQFAAALQNGVETAYKAVVRPVEGTILTVAKEAARYATNYARRYSTIPELMEAVLAHAREALARTPDQLPVLKQVGVVDAGGQGLVIIYEGFLLALSNGEYHTETPIIKPQFAADKPIPRQSDKAQAKIATEDIENPYDMEFFIHLQSGSHRFDEEIFRGQLERMGDSIIVIPDDDVVKVHVHSNAPGDVLNLSIKFGELHQIHILNMKDQHRELLADEEYSLSGGSEGPSSEPEQRMKPYGIIAVAAGEGLAEIMSSIGVDYVLSGGQTMNPSTEDIMNAIQEVRAETVFILPNNSNIILAAQQAKDLAEVRVEVIPSKTIPQGMAAVLSFQEQADADANAEAMRSAITRVKSGQVTYAIRDSQMDGLTISKDDYLGILDNKIVVSDPDLLTVCEQLMNQMLETGDEMVTILTGEGSSEDMTSSLIDKLSDVYPDAEVEVHPGGQPVYAYIFSVE